MSFKKAVEQAKKMQQNFTVELPDGSGGTFEGIFKILTGEEAVWTYRIQRKNETEISFEIIQNFRLFCASILAFKSKNENGQEEILQIGDILKMLYLPEELEDVKSLPLNFDEIGLNELIYSQYLTAIKNIKSEEDYKKLPLPAREFAWELIYKGMYILFDQDYVFTLTTTFLDAYRKIRPNPAEEQLMTSIIQIVNEAKAQAAKTEKENESKEAQDNSTGSEISTS